MEWGLVLFGVIKKALFKKIRLERSLTECSRASLGQKAWEDVCRGRDCSARMRTEPREKVERVPEQHPKAP